MLSYRHAFHAGNYADVLKHLVLVKSFEYMLQKPAPIMYIDTHSGAGRYPFDNSMSQKTNEYAEGAGALRVDRLPESFAGYAELLESFAAERVYPGSPLIAAQMLRREDKLRMFELHPSDFSKLDKLFSRDRRARVEQSDGHKGLKGLLPAQQKRALVLMDPSFEVKKEYQEVVASLVEGYKRMPGATFLLWYPVVQREQIDRMIQQLRKSKIKNIWQFELGVAADSKEYGMTASGVIAINPAWVLPKQMEELLPELQRQLAPEGGFYKVENLVAE